MNLAEQLQALVAKGFREDQAQIILMMREAAIVLFDAFPDALLLVGGANLILFQDSNRHSSDLDLMPIGELPSFDVVKEILERGLAPLSELLEVDPLAIDMVGGGLIVRGPEKRLFSIDIGGVGSVIRTNTDTHKLEATGTDRIADVQSASRDQLLLLKAEAFLLRRNVKARDAYDMMRLLERGASFSGNLKQHLEDQIIGEFDSERIRERINSLNPALCRADLERFIPEGIYHALEESAFKPLRDAVSTILVDWI